VKKTVEGSFAHGKDAIHAAYRVIDGYNPTSVAIPVARAGGVTSVVSTPRGGLVSGTSAWFSLAAGPVADVTSVAPLAMYATLGEGALGSAEGSRGVALEKLRELLDDALHYGKRRREYDRNQSRELAAARLDLEALLPVARGQLPLVVRVHKSSDILAALRLGREFGLRIIIEGGAEAWMVAEELARAKVPVILNPNHNLPMSFDRIHVRDDAAHVLARAGVRVAISGLGGATWVAGLRHSAGNAVADGLAYDKALAAVTTVPAEIFGVKKRGVVTPGAVADVVVWSGDPFELSSHAVHVIIGGVEQSLRTRKTLLLERYRKLPARD
jgi:imidazolonepropionase-like amidohydrolase